MAFSAFWADSTVESIFAGHHCMFESFTGWVFPWLHSDGDACYFWRPVQRYIYLKLAYRKLLTIWSLTPVTSELFSCFIGGPLILLVNMFSFGIRSLWLKCRLGSNPRGQVVFVSVPVTTPQWFPGKLLRHHASVVS